VYLLACLRDAAIAQWMHLSKGLIRIFKEQFPAFEKEVLKPLSNCYPVIIISSGLNKSKRK